MQLFRRCWETYERAKKWKTLTSNANSEDPMVARALGNYRIVRKIGSGWMSAVYQAVPDLTLSENESVAIKVIIGDSLEDWDHNARYRQDIALLRTMSHPHIIRIIDFGEDGGLLYVVMELVRGKTLKDGILKGGFPLEVFMRIFRQILEALDHIHKKGIVHFRPRPHNIMMSDGGSIIIMDFGLTRSLHHTIATVEGKTLGGPAYMSPEEISGRPIDLRADQYSLGTMAFEMLTGQRPFAGENFVEIILKQMTELPPPLGSFRPDLPKSLDAVILRMICKDPEQRFSDLQQALASLEGIEG